MISLLLPTRKRPMNLIRFAHSVINTASTNPEIICYVDADDNSYDSLQIGIEIRKMPRRSMSEMWTALVPFARGDIFMLAADDVMFKTEGWDVLVETAFAAVPDRILLVHGDDLGPAGKTFATLPFVSREWVNAVGYFTPPGFTCDWCDTWLDEVATMIGRKRFLPFEVEHMHRIYGKAPMDSTYQETLDRDRRDNNSQRYIQRKHERLADAEKLRKVMK